MGTSGLIEKTASDAVTMPFERFLAAWEAVLGLGRTSKGGCYEAAQYPCPLGVSWRLGKRYSGWAEPPKEVATKRRSIHALWAFLGGLESGTRVGQNLQRRLLRSSAVAMPFGRFLAAWEAVLGLG